LTPDTIAGFLGRFCDITFLLLLLTVHENLSGPFISWLLRYLFYFCSLWNLNYIWDFERPSAFPE